jgi:hypothetical protein
LDALRLAYARRKEPSGEDRFLLERRSMGLIGVSEFNGELRIQARIRVSSSWSPKRIAKLVELLDAYVRAVDADEDLDEKYRYIRKEDRECLKKRSESTA